MRVLVVDDDDGVRFTIRSALEDAGFHVDEAKDGIDALRQLNEQNYRIVITDLRMPHMDGLELLKQIQTKKPEFLPRVIMITAHGSERHAVAAIRAGAYDYFSKPFELDELLTVVNRAADIVRLENDNERLKAELCLARSLVFVSPAMTQLATFVQRIGPRDVTVLITGETGTGKERVAEAIVRASNRASKPFVRFNCASLSGDLVEAELFGHTRGAFTGAQRARPGLFREANGGTILLDEVGELEPTVQARLLRVLQEREVRALGDDRPEKIDVRVMAATHRDLKTMVAEGRFREDLYYRLNVVTLSIPPLRERREDIPALVNYFVNKFTERFNNGPLLVPQDIMAQLSSMPWPGNVRELENTVERLVALAHDGVVDGTLLTSAPSEEFSFALGLKERVEAYEKGLIAEALQQAKGNRTDTARILKVSRVTLYDKLKKYGFELENS